MRTEMTYDAAGRTHIVTAKRGGATEGTATFEYLHGRLASVNDSTRGGVESYTYDFAGRLATIAFPEGRQLSFLHDYRGRATSEIYWGEGLQVFAFLSMSYDLADRETSVSNLGSSILTRTYTDGRLAEVAYGNGLVRTLTYDGVDGLPNRTRTRNAADNLVEDTTITRSTPAGELNRTVTVNTVTSGGLAKTTTETYLLGPVEGLDPNGDAGHRLVRWENGSGGRRYAFDLLGNRASDGTDIFAYNAERNRLVSANVGGTALAYTYDEAGFATSRGGAPITWNAQGMVASVGFDRAFEWDMLGRPLSVTSEGTTVPYLYGGRVQANSAGNPAVISRAEWRLDLASGSRRYRHLDLRGNVKFVSNDAGSIVTHYRYDGYRVDGVFGDASDKVRFAAGLHVEDLTLLGARIYDPAVGRFLSQDPLLNPINQYAYTMGNPLDFADRGGFSETSQALGGFAMAIGFTVMVEGVGVGVESVAVGVVAYATGATLAPAVVGLLVAVVVVGGGAYIVYEGYRIVYEGDPANAEVGSPTSRAVAAPGRGKKEGTSKASSGTGPYGASGRTTFTGYKGVSATTSSGCSPATLSRLPDFGWILLLLLPLQLGLAGAMMRRRRNR